MIDQNLTGIIISLGICLALPVLIVWLVTRVRINNDNRRSQILIEAIKATNGVNTDKLAEALSKPRRTFFQTMMNRLLCGCIWGFIGLAFIIFGFISLGNPDSWEDDGPALFFVGIALTGIGISYLIIYFMMKKRMGQGTDNNINDNDLIESNIL